MRRGFIVVGWVAGTAAAVGVGVRAVGVVSSSVTENRPAALSTEMVADRLAAQTTTTTAGGTSTSSTEATGATTTSGPAPTTASTSPPTTATTPTTTTDPTRPRPEERTYQLVGGTVAVRFEDGVARLLWATPKPGFRVESHHEGPPEVDVRFESEDHESRLRAWWDNGPQAETREDRDD